MAARSWAPPGPPSIAGRWTSTGALRRATRTPAAARSSRSAPRLDVRPIAERVARRVLAGKDDPALKWLTADRQRVLVRIGTLIPTGSAFKQTLEGRRKRLQAAVRERLEAAGWVTVWGNTYERRPSGAPSPG